MTISWSTTKKIVLNNSGNKVQLIELICQYIRNNKHHLPLGHTLVISAQSPIPVKLFHGNKIQRKYLCNSHKESDSVIIYLMLHTAIKKKSKSIMDIWWAIQVLYSCDSLIKRWTSPCRSTTIDLMWLFFRQTISKCKM